VTRLTSPVFIGRTEQLAQITQALDKAPGGESSILLVGGEAGVGKSRLVSEGLHIAQDRGMVTMIGGCLDVGGSGVPFAPIREALRSLVAGAEPDQLDAILGPGATDLRALLPGPATRASRSAVNLTADVAQAKLFEAVLGLLRHLAASGTPVMAIEDIHWADSSTLDLLRFLSRNHKQADFVLLATFRSDELSRRHPLVPVLAELQRTPAVTRLEVPRFDAAETSDMVRAITGDEIGTDGVASIHERSNGLPFYAEELLAARSGDAGASASLRDVVLARIRDLSDETQDLLRCASVVGSVVTTGVLGQVVGRDPADVAAPLREAVEMHILVPIEDGREERYEFRHMLVHEAFYGQLLPGERSRLHGKVAHVLAGAPYSDPSTAVELAQHWFAAHDIPRAFEAAMAAGDACLGIYAFQAAYRNYERVLELWDQVPDAEKRLGKDRIAVLELAARAASAEFPEQSLALIDEAIRLASGVVANSRLGLLKEQYGRYAYNSGDGYAALAACREAVAQVPADPPTLGRARVLASLGQILMVTLSTEEAAVVCREAVAAARAVGSIELEANALCSLGVATVYLGDLETGLQLLTESRELAERVDSVEDVARALGNLTDVLIYSGKFDEGARAGLEAFGYADRNGLGAFLGAVDLCEAGFAFYRAGAWEGARATFSKVAGLTTSVIAQVMLGERWALLDVGQGLFEQAARRLEGVEPMTARVVEAQLVAPQAEAAAEMALWEGRPDGARLVVDRALRRLPASKAAYLSRLGPLFFLGVRAEADASIAGRARRETAAVEESRRRAVELTEQLRGVRDEVVATLPNFAAQADAWLAACEAELARLDGSRDPETWAAADESFERIGMPYLQAYAKLRLCEATLGSRGSRSSAAMTLRDAREICVRLGAQPLLAEIDRLALRARLDLAGAGSAEAAAEGPPPASDSGLTTREREVLGLVAVGKTNRQIAELLFITEGTAGAHVSNILGKLGVSGRTEAAAVAFRLGLIDAGNGT